MATRVLSALSETKKGAAETAPHSRLVTMKIFCAITSAASLALGIDIAHDQARAQAVGCVVMEVGGDRETLRQQSPSFLDERGKRGKEKIPKNQAPLADDAVRPSAREAAFALGQSLADLGCLTLGEWANDEPPPGTARQE
jgi:hypothetical protein